MFGASIILFKYGSAAPAPAPPVNTVAPLIIYTDTPPFGSLVNPGTWTGTAPITFTYNWQYSIDNITFVDFAPAEIGTNIVLPFTGIYIWCQVTGTNIDGSSTANSNSMLARMIWDFPSLANWGDLTLENWN